MDRLRDNPVLTGRLPQELEVKLRQISIKGKETETRITLITIYSKYILLNTDSFFAVWTLTNWSDV
jgi:hypothetical protein